MPPRSKRIATWRSTCVDTCVHTQLQARRHECAAHRMADMGCGRIVVVFVVAAAAVVMVLMVVVVAVVGVVVVVAAAAAAVVVVAYITLGGSGRVVVSLDSQRVVDDRRLPSRIERL